MEGFSYQEFAEQINAYFKDMLSFHVTARTVKFWVTSGLLPEPKGSGRWRYFDALDLKEAISLRKLQVYHSQSIEDIKAIINKVDTWGTVYNFPSEYHLSKFHSAFVHSPRQDDPVKEIESFKEGELFLVYDDAYSPPYRLLDENENSDSYIEEDGQIYRVLHSIKDENGKDIYYKPDNIEAFLKDKEDNLERLHIEIGRPPKTIEELKKEAERIRGFINTGLMTAPRYRFKRGNYLSESNILTAQHWRTFKDVYGLTVDELKHLRTRIEYDIEHYFYVPEISPYFDPIFYQFQRQVILVDSCISSIAINLSVLEESPGDHTKEDSQRLIRAYLKGFYFFCSSFSNDLESICLSKTPINRLSPEQIKTGLTEGRFTRKEVEEIVSAKEADLKALKSIVKKK